MRRFLRNHGSRKKDQQVKILHCPEIVGGNAQQLARSERELGLNSCAVVFRQNYLSYQTDLTLLPAGAPRWKVEIVRWKLLWMALSCDVIHYNSGQTIMPTAVHFRDARLEGIPLLARFFLHVYTHALELLDVHLLKFLGKGILITFQGDDVRQGDFCRRNFRIHFSDEVENGYYSLISDRLKRARIKKIAKLADRIYAVNPDLLHVLPPSAQFMPYGHINFRDWSVCKNFSDADCPLILHAPSHRGIKGTRFIYPVLDRLRSDGVKFEFVQIEGMSRAEARKVYERADLLIDQLLAGWYGGLAVELMALGKPVVAYIRENDLKYIPSEMASELPIIYADPESLYKVLHYYLTEGKSALKDIGLRGRQYVERWHNSKSIAYKLKQNYEAILGVADVNCS